MSPRCVNVSICLDELLGTYLRFISCSAGCDMVRLRFPPNMSERRTEPTMSRERYTVNFADDNHAFAGYRGNPGKHVVIMHYAQLGNLYADFQDAVDGKFERIFLDEAYWMRRCEETNTVSMLRAFRRLFKSVVTYMAR